MHISTHACASCRHNGFQLGTTRQNCLVGEEMSDEVNIYANLSGLCIRVNRVLSTGL